MVVAETCSQIGKAHKGIHEIELKIIPCRNSPKSDLIDLTLSKARRFYSSKGDPLGTKGLT